MLPSPGVVLGSAWALFGSAFLVLGVCCVYVSLVRSMRSVRSQASGLPSPGMSLAAPAPAAANGPVAVPPRIIGAARDPPCPPPPSPKLPFLLFLSPLFLL